MGLNSGGNSDGDSGGDSSGYSCIRETLPRELLLDSWPLREQAPHMRDLHQQSSWPPRQPPTPLAAATRTRIGMQCSPDGVGWLTLFIAILMICVKTIITLLYPHLLAVIPPTFLLPTHALPTPVPVASTLHLTPRCPTSTRRLPPLVSAWQTASQCGLLLVLR